MGDRTWAFFSTGYNIDSRYQNIKTCKTTYSGLFNFHENVKQDGRRGDQQKRNMFK